jgi:hypothetical protein
MLHDLSMNGSGRENVGLFLRKGISTGPGKEEYGSFMPSFVPSCPGGWSMPKGGLNP